MRLGDGPDPALLVWGELRWLDGPQAGIAAGIIGLEEGWLILDRAPPGTLPNAPRVVVGEGCDHTLDTCAARFANAINFQGEPFLPGNDLLTRYGNPAS